MGTLDKVTNWVREDVLGIDDPPKPTKPPDPTIERAKAEEAAAKKNEERRRAILEGGRQSTIHALGSTEEEAKDTLGA